MKFCRVNVSGSKYFISEKNVLSNGPNLFTETLFNVNNKNYKGMKRMAVDRSPVMFEFIQRFLQGYNLDTSDWKTMDVNNLLQDACYYKLPELVYALNDAKKQKKEVKELCRKSKDYYRPLKNYSSSDDSCSFTSSSSSSSTLLLDSSSLSNVDFDTEIDSDDDEMERLRCRTRNLQNWLMIVKKNE